MGGTREDEEELPPGRRGKKRRRGEEGRKVLCRRDAAQDYRARSEWVSGDLFSFKSEDAKKCIDINHADPKHVR